MYRGNNGARTTKFNPILLKDMGTEQNALAPPPAKDETRRIERRSKTPS